jgi:hypothetical protein
VSSAKRARWTPGFGGVIYIQAIQCSGQKEPCGTSVCISFGVDNSPLNFLLDRFESISLIKLVENYNFDNLYSKPMCHVVSKAFSMSNNTAAVDILLKFRVV